MNLLFNNDTIIYLLEDDYLHREGWSKVLLEGIALPSVDYVTLFDHRDKYGEDYTELQSKIFATDTCHFRTIPSTTNTHAMYFETLKRDLKIHKKYSIDKEITSDHKKFLKLGRRGAILVSSIPGYCTHVEPQYSSPCYDWKKCFGVKEPAPL